MYRKNNFWISLLKIMCCYLVVLDHFGLTEFAKTLISAVGSLPVPIFFFLSFYLCGKKIYDKEGYIINRFKRLYYPVFLWSVVYFFLYNFVRLITGKELIPIINIVYSCITGVSEKMNTPMWYNMATLIITVTFYMIMVCEKNMRKRERIFLFLIVISEVLIYLGVNGYLFSGMSFESGITIGRIMECIPFAAMGMLVCNHVDKIKWIYVVGLVPIAVISWFISKPIGFGYQGLWLLVMSVIICVCVIKLPKLPQSVLNDTVNFIAKYTMGVYFMHLGVGYALTMLPFVTVNHRGLTYAFVVTIICFCAVFIMDKVSEKVPFLRWMKYMVV